MRYQLYATYAQYIYYTTWYILCNMYCSFFYQLEQDPDRQAEVDALFDSPPGQHLLRFIKACLGE